VAPFAGTGLAFGLLYNTLFYPRTPVEYLEAGTIGVLLGVGAGLAEQTALGRWLQRGSFLRAVLARTAAYSVLVALMLALVLSIEPASQGTCSYFGCLDEYVRSPQFLRDLLFSTAFVFFAAFAAHVVLLVGTRNFGRLLVGRYRRPRELRATFMFVDIRDSTRLAEELGHERFSALLRDFFAAVSGAIHHAKGEVYQYIGDEVVIVWPGSRAAGQWVSCFNDMRQAVEAERQTFEREYGCVPEFKAGVHTGEAVVTEIGTLQRAHAYHGDVLNTAARIQAKCNEVGFDLLASREALSAVNRQQLEGFVPMGALPLRGKAQPVEVFGLAESKVGRSSAV